MHLTPILKSVGVVLIFFMIICPAIQLIVSGENSDNAYWQNYWHNTAPFPRCEFPPFYAVLYLLPSFIVCVLCSFFQGIRQFSAVCLNLAVREIEVLLPSFIWISSPTSIDGHHNVSGREAELHPLPWLKRRSFSSGTDPRDCAPLHKDTLAHAQCVADAMKKAAKRDLTYIITASIVAVLACGCFAALIVKYMRRGDAAAKVRKETNSVGRVGLGRGLGSTAGKDIDVRSGASTQKNDIERDLEGNGDEFVAPTISRHSSSASGWRRLLRRDPSIEKENSFLAPMAIDMPPRIATPNLPGALNMLSDSTRRAGNWKLRKPLTGLDFEDLEILPKPAFNIPEIRVISTGSNY